MVKPALGQLMRQAQEMQEKMRKLQTELQQLEVTGGAGAGLVKVTLTGKHEARKVEISPDAMTEGREFLEDLVGAAINDAARKLEAETQARTAQATSGLSLPAGLDLSQLGL
ncbi:MAG TPA: YbaB/EbfC family nucleoid-associated protein [Nevskiaceae bacterium]|nr:YbaB/EbfC family nucleoid-associated protein [Nevskiaceae bacterium]